MTEKRYSLLYGIDENPYEWDIIDNEKNSIIYQSNGIAICNELNELNDELGKLTSLYSAKCKTEETLIKEGERLEKENKELKEQVDEMINIFNDSGLDYHISDELEEILND